MATIAKGTATFTSGGAETSTFSWVDTITGNAVTFGATPTIIGASMTVTDGTGPGVAYFNGAGAVTTTGATVTCANPPTCTVLVTAIG